MTLYVAYNIVCQTYSVVMFDIVRAPIVLTQSNITLTTPWPTGLAHLHQEMPITGRPTQSRAASPPLLHHVGLMMNFDPY